MVSETLWNVYSEQHNSGIDVRLKTHYKHKHEINDGGPRYSPIHSDHDRLTPCFLICRYTSAHKIANCCSSMPRTVASAANDFRWRESLASKSEVTPGIPPD